MCVAALSAACVAALWAAPAAAQKVGTAAAVNPLSNGAPPGGGVRTLVLGAEVVHNERIRTDGRGSVQLLFIDRTSMSIGPNSDITIDEYVFDPRAGTGRLIVRLWKGLLRFVGGQVSHGGEATVATSSAAVGIRGGTGIIMADGAHTRTINLFGRQTVTAGGMHISLYHPGYMLDVYGASVPSPPVPAPHGLIAALNSEFQARRGQNGGSGGRVTPPIVEAVADAYDVTGRLGPGVNPVQPPTTYLRFLTTEPTWPIYFQTGTTWETTLLAVQQGQQSAAAQATAIDFVRQLILSRVPR